MRFICIFFEKKLKKNLSTCRLGHTGRTGGHGEMEDYRRKDWQFWFAVSNFIEMIISNMACGL